MRARNYCAHHNTRNHWTLRCMNRCPDLVVIPTRDLQCLRPIKLGTHLSTQCTGDEGPESTLPSPLIEPKTCGVEARYTTTRPYSVKNKT
ncbi:hypothetical protein TNCV_3500211 [Trichonephila clavipes]|nr:hypothetical protein TNCV_3500211 [Trichonephila clavipes]